MKTSMLEVIGLSVIWCLLGSVRCTELTFELEDNAKQCFHEVISKGVKCTLEFQVVTGGHYDVDVTLKDPNGKVLYDQKKKQYDSYQFKTDIEGEYTFCFGNEFSSFSHKTVYFDIQTGEAPPLPTMPHLDSNLGAMTQLETSAVNIHEALKVIIDYQTHYKLRMSTGRSVAEYLFDRIKYWSFGQTVLMVLVAAGQVYTLRNFFAERKETI